LLPLVCAETAREAGRKGKREVEQDDQEAVVEERTRDTMSLDAHDLPPDLEELETVEKQALLPSNLSLSSTVSAITPW
jgi:hypothetical protein